MATTISGNTGVSQCQPGSVSQDDMAANVVGMGAAFAAYSSAGQTVPTSTWAKINFNTEVFDTNANFDPVTQRFTATVAGYYQVTVAANSQATAGGAFIVLYKNGVVTSTQFGMVSSPGVVLSASGLVYLALNDYIEGYFLHSQGSNTTVQGVQFSGCLVRAV